MKSLPQNTKNDSDIESQQNVAKQNLVRGFTHLHTHSHYSLLNALPKIPDLVAAAKADKMKALALTDNANLYGALEFYKACKKAEIKPIIGIDAYLSLRSRSDKEGRLDKGWYRLVLLAKDLAGWKSLLQLVTTAHLEGFYYKPRIDKELLEAHHDGLLCISPSFSGDIAKAVEIGDFEKARELVAFYKKLFGDDFYIEITHHPEIANHEDKMKALTAFARENKVPLVAAHDVYYLKPEDKRARDTILSIQSNNPERAWNDEEEDFSFLSQKEAEKRFKNEPDALANVALVVEKCNLELKLGEWKFPRFEVESGLSHDEELRRLAFEGLEKRGLKKTPEVLERLEYELGVIKNKGYAPYFLVVGDLLRAAHERGILTTIRGSVAGSLATYLVGITNVNPLEYRLPFERFLNPERPSAPDIDMDYADNRRDEMIQYAKDKYGEANVAQIGTFGTMMARGAVRDVARALGYSYNVGDKIAKLIPMGSQGFPMTIDHAMELEPELKKLYKEDTETKEIIDMAKKIEGNARHISVHAAGVVISPDPLVEYVPLQMDPKAGKLITQFDMHSVDEDSAGLLKFDFLGIRNLAILAHAVKLAKKLYNVEIDIENVPVDDQKTFDILAKGETVGLFQLNGQGMTRYLKELRPTAIHDINAMVALYRPGPLESIPSYIERKHNPHKVSYLDPRMKDILDRSYGVITYQDDVMMIAIKLGGFSWLEADKLRKAMGKKIPELMEEQHKKLIDGLTKNGMTPAKADQLWKLIEPFAAYGFNKAHAASYGRVAYQTAYMKANYPAVYMSAVLTADSGDVLKIAEIIAECKRMDIPVLPPDINESFEDFTVVKNPEGRESIRFGLTTIKNFGEGIAHTIIEERKSGGKFKDAADFLIRIKDRNLNKKSLEALIKSGAMDEFGERGVLLGNLDRLLQFNKESAAQNADQNSLFGAVLAGPAIKLEPTEPAKNEDVLAWEKELLGLYISGHPLEKYREKLEARGSNLSKLAEAPDNVQVVVAGIIDEAKEIMTKGGDKMVFLSITDFFGTAEVVVFPRVLAENKDVCLPDQCVVVRGKVSRRNGEPSVIADKIRKL